VKLEVKSRLLFVAIGRTVVEGGSVFSVWEIGFRNGLYRSFENEIMSDW
jgi:hypothetical protein